MNHTIYSKNNILSKIAPCKSMDENYIKTLCDLLDFDVTMKSETIITKTSIEENDCNTKYKLVSIF